MATMNHYYFFRENGNFDDILKDQVLRRHLSPVITWPHHLYVCLNDQSSDGNELHSYMRLKYGDDLVSKDICTDHSPRPGVDYNIKWPENYTGPRPGRTD